MTSLASSTTEDTMNNFDVVADGDRSAVIRTSHSLVDTLMNAVVVCMDISAMIGTAINRWRCCWVCGIAMVEVSMNEVHR